MDPRANAVGLLRRRRPFSGTFERNDLLDRIEIACHGGDVTRLLDPHEHIRLAGRPRSRISRHERKKQERREHHQVDCALHHVCAPRGQGHGAHDERQGQHDDVLRLVEAEH